MTTIFKVSNQEDITPAFAQVERDVVSQIMAPIGQKFATTLDDDSVSSEMERVEKCASSGTDYVYSSEWAPEHVAQLREYATVCGLKGKFLPVRQAEEVKPVEHEDDADMRHLAQLAIAKPRVSADLALAVGDPFKLTDLEDSQPKQEKWEQVRPERKLASQPSMQGRSAGITAIRGEFEYGTSTQLRVRRGENSVANPDAIGELAKEQDSGERLKSDNATRQSERKAAKSAWQKEAVHEAKAMGAGSLPRGSVMLASDSAPKYANSGLELKQATEELSKVNDPFKHELPDLTDGERIKGSNTSRKSEIQRVAVKDDWQKVKGTTKPSLTDEFADALEKQLSVAGISVGGKV